MSHSFREKNLLEKKNRLEFLGMTEASVQVGTYLTRDSSHQEQSATAFGYRQRYF